MGNKTLIVCCPRSGSKFTCKVLAKYGLDFTHEGEVGEDGNISWYLAPTFADEAKIIQKKNFKLVIDNQVNYVLKKPYHIIYPIPTVDFKRAYRLIHQVRDPLKSIGSMYKIFPRSWEWARPFINIDKGDTKLTFYMKMWYYWNIMCEEQSEFTYKIEDLFNSLDQFCSVLGIEDKNKVKSIIEQMPKRINNRGIHPKITWEKMREDNLEMADRIQQLAEKYGYCIV